MQKKSRNMIMKEKNTAKKEWKVSSIYDLEIILVNNATYFHLFKYG